ncbi:MAG TPA: hypothetical protein VFK33_10840 [Bacillales bacterium]|nr:hypothetical protein [Bacillales bacterium]
MSIEEILAKYPPDEADEIARAVGIFQGLAEQIAEKHMFDVGKVQEAMSIAVKYPDVFGDFETLYDLIYQGLLQ